jgi:UDP-N-acetylglucosamine/UDP-N-acetylgalactosamine diphosphorylase
MFALPRWWLDERNSVTQEPLDEQALRQRAAEAGQEHVFRFWGDLGKESRQHLLAQLAGVDFDELADLIRHHVTGVPSTAGPTALPPDLRPAPFIPLPTAEADVARRRDMRELGEEILAAGKAAAMVVAGGQGTRLGYEGPKGAFPIGPVSERPLFEIFAHAILAARRAYAAPIPWYIMTSQANDLETRDFFEAHNYFDLPVTDIKCFAQGMMPAVDLQGKLLLAKRDELAWNPDGHGGSIRALARCGMLADMAARGIEYVSYFQVDNPLVPPLDPVFLGCHADARSDMSSKMARKRDPKEKLGVFCMTEGRLHVIEYSDLPNTLAEERNTDGSLRFGAGSIAIHILSRRFVERLSGGRRFALPFHRAEKKIPCVDEKGRTRSPDRPNGVKFETFVFDALPMAERPVVLEIDRRCEFSPVKNADGLDTPATARRDMVRLDAKRLEEAGVKVPRDAAGEPKFKVEISPLVARRAEELKAVVARLNLRAIVADVYLGPEDVPPS